MWTNPECPLLLANLVDKSMVQLVDEDLPRYRLLETLREYGRDRLSEAERNSGPGSTCSVVPRSGRTMCSVVGGLG